MFQWVRCRIPNPVLKGRWPMRSWLSAAHSCPASCPMLPGLPQKRPVLLGDGNSSRLNWALYYQRLASNHIDCNSQMLSGKSRIFTFLVSFFPAKLGNAAACKFQSGSPERQIEMNSWASLFTPKKVRAFKGSRQKSASGLICLWMAQTINQPQPNKIRYVCSCISSCIELC